MKMQKSFFKRTIWLALSGFVFLFFSSNLNAQNEKLKLRSANELKSFYAAQELKLAPAQKSVLEATRLKIKQQKLLFTVGATSKLGVPIDQLTGESQTSPQEASAIQSAMNQQAEQGGDGGGDSSGGLPSSFDSRTRGWVSPVRDQFNCGSCWAYAAVAMYESNYLKRNGGSINASEQHVLACSGGGNCPQGGFSFRVYEWMVNNTKNLFTESQMAYTSTTLNSPNGSCPSNAPTTDYYATSWKVIRPDGDITKIADVNDIKRGIMDYGAVNASLFVNSDWDGYNGGVLNGMPSNPSSPSTNHAILIVGWDDSKQAFLVKNSWGNDWGLDGFCWVRYGHYNVGRRAAVVNARPKDFWAEVPNGGLGKQITFHKKLGNVWVIGLNDGIWYNPNGAWRELSGGGRALDLTMTETGPFCIGTDNRIYDHNGSGWIALPSGLGKRIAHDPVNSKIWVIGTNDGIYSWNGSGWTEYPGGGRGKDIAVHNGIPYVIGTNDRIYRGTGSGWEEVAGGGLGKRIALDAGGNPWVIGTNDGIFYHRGSSWTEYPGGGRGKDLIVPNYTPYVIGTNNRIYKGTQAMTPFIISLINPNILLNTNFRVKMN